MIHSILDSHELTVPFDYTDESLDTRVYGISYGFNEVLALVRAIQKGAADRNERMSEDEVEVLCDLLYARIEELSNHILGE